MSLLTTYVNGFDKKRKEKRIHVFKYDHVCRESRDHEFNQIHLDGEDTALPCEFDRS
jgi:hypothetical protein